MQELKSQPEVIHCAEIKITLSITEHTDEVLNQKITHLARASADEG
jgi:hypothetical protein